MPIQNTKAKKPGKRLVSKPDKRKNSAAKKVEFVRKTAEATGETLVTATTGEQSGSFIGGVEAWRKVALRRRKDRRKIGPKVIFERGEGSFADIFRKLKAVPKLTNLEDNAACIERSQKGNLMLERKKSRDIFLNQIRSRHKG